uniref:Uncharacterized protein n=1 Tax=Hyaloperonospora arabidopsidis (strain Emoy2) TaxID=559515 RepID=M4BP47_HYAAE
MVGQDAILGMNFMVPDGIRLDLADGTLRLPNKVRIQLFGRRTVHDNRAIDVKMGQYARILAGGCVEAPLKRSISGLWRTWVTRGERWVTTMTRAIERRQLLKVTNVSPHTLILHGDTKIGMWLTKDKVPQAQGFVSVGSPRYAEWLNLAYEATTDQVDPQVDLEEKGRHP